MTLHIEYSSCVVCAYQEWITHVNTANYVSMCEDRHKITKTADSYSRIRTPG